MNPVAFIGLRGWRPTSTRGWFPRVRRSQRPHLANILATPFGFAAQSRAPTTAFLNWTDVSSSETGFEIDRALGDGSFSNISTTAAGVEEFSNTGLVNNTRYRYRIRAITGSAQSLYTAIITVVTHSCPTAGPFHKELALPRFSDAPESWQVLLNELVNKLETQWNEQVVSEPICTICPTNGAITLDCSRCNRFEVTTSTNINSITVNTCDNSEINVKIVNSGTSPITISGWPEGFNCVTTRCEHTIAAGGALNLGLQCAGEVCLETGPTQPLTGIGGLLSLRIECEQTLDDGDFDDASDGAVTCAPLNCSDTSPQANYRGRGGVPPYTWATTTAAGLPSPVTAEDVGERTIQITPGGTATDSGARAYGRGFVEFTGSGVCTICNNDGGQQYRCDGAAHNNCDSGSACSGICDDDGPSGGTPTEEVAAPPICKRPGSSCDGGVPECNVPTNCNNSANALTFVCDLRSQTQIDSGTCDPCILTMDQIVLTLTDSVGTNVSITVSVSN